MYNLFVTAQVGAWNSSGYEYDRSRVLEYTRDDVRLRFESLDRRRLNALVKLPCLFAYEGKHPMQLGSLVSAKPRGRSIFIEYKLDETLPPIPYERIEPHLKLLDVRDWEMNRTHWAVKNEDLFARLRSVELIPPDTPSPPSTGDLPNPNPADKRIQSAGGFIEAVLALEHPNKEVFYRGHSNKEKYRLEPSLFRTDKDGNYLYLDDEHRIYRELLISNSHDFQNDVYSLDKLIRMQHYSLPTRLLDITSNPLIALYFACRSHGENGADGKPEIPGEVIVFTIAQEEIKYFDSDTASCLANLARMPRPDRDGINFSLTATEFRAQRSIKKLLHFVRQEKPYFENRIKPDDLRSVICVKGKRSNDRISFQSGAFLLFGHEAVLGERGTPKIGVSRIEIADKKRLLAELDQLNINERTVFPYIENSARYIAEKYAFKTPKPEAPAPAGL